MITIKKYSKIITAVILFAAIWAILLFVGRYMLYLQEQLQLFQNDWAYIIDNCEYNTGFAQMVSEFIVQFFYIPWLGTMIMALIIIATIYAFSSIMQHFGINRGIALIAAIIPTIPLLYVVIIAEGTFAFIQYFIAIIATLPILRVCDKHRWIATMVASPILFWICGAPAILLPIFSLILAIQKDRSLKNILINTIPLVIYLLFGYVGIYCGFIGSLNWFINYVTPKPLVADLRYYEPMVVVGWYITPILVIALSMCKKKAHAIATATIFIIGVSTTLMCIPKHIYSAGIYFNTFNHWMKLHYMYTQGEYEELQLLYKSKEPTYVVESNYINLSLMQQGKLATDFFKYAPRDQYALLMKWTDSPLPTAYIWSEVCRQIGFIYKSGQSAYEGEMLSGPRGSAIFTKLMAEAEIVMGNYEVAKRYIEVLEKTIFYKDWATKQRKYLNDQAVMSDAYYSSKRNCLYPTHHLILNTNELDMLLNIIRKNPTHKNSYEFAGIMTMAAGQLQALSSVINIGISTEKIKVPLHPTFQQGLVMAYQKAPALYKAYKIETSLINEFVEYQKATTNGSNTLNQETIIRKNQNRYWHYLRTRDARSSRAHIEPTASQELPSN